MADTPGIRELGLFEIPQSELAWCFPEFRDAPGQAAPSTTARTCTSRAAACGRRSGAGQVSEERYDSYRRMLTGDLAG